MLHDIKMNLRDIPETSGLTMQHIAGRDVYGFAGKLVAVDPSTSQSEIEAEIRAAASPSASLLPPVTVSSPKEKPMSQPGSFAASLRAMLDDARSDLDRARSDGRAVVGAAVEKLKDARTATAHVTGKMASQIEDEAASVMSELGQISNDLGI